MIEDAIEIASSELTLLPELYLLKGDLLLAVPDASDSAAESWFQRGSIWRKILMPRCRNFAPRSGCAVCGAIKVSQQR
jgi:hypothetical protein